MTRLEEYGDLCRRSELPGVSQPQAATRSSAKAHEGRRLNLVMRRMLERERSKGKQKDGTHHFRAYSRTAARTSSGYNGL